MSDLPVPVEEAGLLLQRASIVGDPAALQQIIDWGHAQIDVAYPEDPVRAPLNIWRRLRAHQEWDKVVRTAGRELRGTIMSAIVRDLEFEITLRQEEIRAEDAERRRRSAVTFDTEMRIREHAAIGDINSRIRMHEHQTISRVESQIRLQEHRTFSQINDEIERAHLQLKHVLGQQAEDAASRRRQEERVLETEQQIDKMIADAVVSAMGPNPTDKVIDAARKAGHEIAEIRANPNMTDDDKHLQIQILLQTLPRQFSDLRARDV